MKFESENLSDLNARFFQSAQDILCNEAAAKTVSKRAIEQFEKEYHQHHGKSPRSLSLIGWTQDVLDLEIDTYFYGLLDSIRHHEQDAEKRLLTMLEKRFKKNIQRKVNSDLIHWDKADVEDVVSEAVSTVSNRCLKAEFHGLFIQWAQTVLNHKYQDRRRQKIRRMHREKPVVDETYERVYFQRLSDVVDRRPATEVKPEEAESMREQYPESDPVDPYEGDAFHFKPDILAEGMDLKEQLLNLVGRMKRKACIKVFRVLFSEGDRKFMAEQFPNRSSQQIDVLVSQCRKQLRLEAERTGVL